MAIKAPVIIVNATHTLDIPPKVINQYIVSITQPPILSQLNVRYFHYMEVFLSLFC